jgi:hypothetical protein
MIHPSAAERLAPDLSNFNADRLHAAIHMQAAPKFRRLA